MANDNHASGFIPVNRRSGDCMPSDAYLIASGQAGDIKKGDPVKMTGTGQYITAAAAGEGALHRGYFWGCRFREPNGEQVYPENWIGGQATYGGKDAVALIISEPNIRLEVTCDDLQPSNIGEVADWDAGTSTTPISGKRLVASAAAASGQAMKILGLADRMNRDMTDNAYGVGAVAIVTPAQHELK